MENLNGETLSGGTEQICSFQGYKVTRSALAHLDMGPTTLGFSKVFSNMLLMSDLS